MCTHPYASLGIQLNRVNRALNSGFCNAEGTKTSWWVHATWVCHWKPFTDRWITQTDDATVSALPLAKTWPTPRANLVVALGDNRRNKSSLKSRGSGLPTQCYARSSSEPHAWRLDHRRDRNFLLHMTNSCSRTGQQIVCILKLFALANVAQDCGGACMCVWWMCWLTLESRRPTALRNAAPILLDDTFQTKMSRNSNVIGSEFRITQIRFWSRGPFRFANLVFIGSWTNSFRTSRLRIRRQTSKIVPASRRGAPERTDSSGQWCAAGAW